MSAKQPRCLTLMGDFPTPALRAYVGTFEMIEVCKNKHTFKMKCFMFATLIRKIHCMGRPMDCFSPTGDAKAKREVR